MDSVSGSEEEYDERPGKMSMMRQERARPDQDAIDLSNAEENKVEEESAMSKSSVKDFDEHAGADNAA